MSQIEGDELRGFDNIGWHFGIGAVTTVDKYGNWLLTTEIDYTRRGAFNNTINPNNFKYNIYLPLDYIDIPVTIFYRDPIGNMMIGLGPVYGRLVQQPHEEIRYSYLYPDTSNMAFLKNDIAIAAELRFKVWRRLEIGLKWQYSVFPIKKDWLFTERVTTIETQKWTNNCYNNSVTLRLLWQFGDEPTYKRKRNRK
ncbi:MAG: hypothetical protein K5650_06965 [Bacteroidales bacterium]|nr:hypothetical protein [Bacteroidales bacterium]